MVTQWKSACKVVRAKPLSASLRTTGAADSTLTKTAQSVGCDGWRLAYGVSPKRGKSALWIWPGGRMSDLGAVLWRLAFGMRGDLGELRVAAGELAYGCMASDQPIRAARRRLD